MALAFVAMVALLPQIFLGAMAVVWHICVPVSVRASTLAGVPEAPSPALRA
jgi:hypothetical protein